MWKKNNKNGEIKILLIGMGHEAQANGLIARKISALREKGFSESALEKEEQFLKAMRDTMRNIAKDFNPDLVVEEGGAYEKVPGDRWKKTLRRGTTYLEEIFSEKHMFVDVKMPKLFKWVWLSHKNRERAFVCMFLERVQAQETTKKVVFVVGAAHLERVAKLLERKGFVIEKRNLKKEFLTNELRDVIRVEMKRISGKSSGEELYKIDE